jgi:chemotaxis protein CheD
VSAKRVAAALHAPDGDTGLRADASDAPPGPAATVRRLYLHAGQLHASAEACYVTTILGSCVAVCLWDGHAGVGGVNHFLLPYCPADAALANARFGNVAMARLIERLIALGARRDRLQAKVFGGACVIEAFRGSGRHLGEKNVEMAMGALEEAAIPVVSRDVGGHHGRKLVFDTGEGAAWVRPL